MTGPGERRPDEPLPGGSGPSEVSEPSGAQGTGGSGQPVSADPGASMPKPTEDPGAVRRAEPDQPDADDTAEGGEPAPQAPVGWLPRGAEEIFGAGAAAEEAYALLTVDVPAERWIAALEAARDELGCTYFDWLSAVDEPGTGLAVCAHLAALPTEPGTGVRRMIVRTTVPHEEPALPTATGVYPGAAWHERETHEMFGVGFTGHPHLVPLLLPDGFEGHPLRKDFVLAARVAKAWPGAKEPGESGHGGPKRRQMLPPGVPDPNEWGPQKGQLPPAPSRPARGRAGRGAAAAGDRPARRTRSASEGSASRRPAGAETTAPERPARRTRSASGGSASQRDAGTGEDAPGGQGTGDEPAGPRETARGGAEPTRREAGAGSTERTAEEDQSGTEGPGSQAAPRSSDAPWHHARPAFGDAGATRDDGEAPGEGLPPGDGAGDRGEDGADDRGEPGDGGGGEPGGHGDEKGGER